MADNGNGEKSVRINLPLTGENHDFIKVMARAAGMSMTAYTNAIIARYRTENAGKYNEIKGRQDELKP